MTPVRRAALWLGMALAAALALIVVFLLSSWVGSSIARNGDWQEPDNGITIMIETNGVHTAIVMPLISPQKDWREEFPASDLERPDWPYTHVSVSWGEREVFLNTPQWTDLTPSTALGAIIGGDALLHVAHYANPAPSPNHRELRITPAEYARLITAIERSTASQETRQSYPGYSWYDVFYDTPGTYHFANTCNQWTSDMLAEAGIKTGLWTPLAGGVMKWVPEQPSS